MRHTIQIHMTNKCNLKCEYCYINQNSEELNFDLLKKQINNVEILSKKLDDSFNGEYDITYFGGEPLLKFNDILKFDNYICDVLDVKRKFIQTNGIELTKDKVNILSNNNINIGISCDGCSDKNHTFIENLYHENVVSMQPKMMVDGYNVKNMMKNILYFFDIAIKNNNQSFYIDVSFVKDDVWNKQSLDELKKQLNQLHDFIIDCYAHTGFLLCIGFVDRIIQNIVYGKRDFICFAGKNGFSITPSGIIYPCSRFYSSDKYKLYDSNIDKFYYDTIKYIREHNNTENEKCCNCSIKKYCNQGCYFSQLEKGDVIEEFCQVMRMSFKMVSNLYKDMKNRFNVDIVEERSKILR